MTHFRLGVGCGVGRQARHAGGLAGRAFLWMDQFLDTARAGPFWLRMAPIAASVVDAIAFGQNPLKHYEVGAFVVIPNNVHLLLFERGPFDQHPPAGLPALRTWRSTPQRHPRP